MWHNPNLFSGFAWSHYLISIGSLNFNLYHGLTIALIYYLSSEHTTPAISTKLLFQTDPRTGPLLEHAFKIHLDTYINHPVNFTVPYHNTKYYGINIRLTILTQCDHQSYSRIRSLVCFCSTNVDTLR